MIRETEMYVPIKNFFNSLGFKVKAEIRNCDVIAYKTDEPPIIIELKTHFSLNLILQGIQRLSISDRVYISVANNGSSSKKSIWFKKRKEIIDLCQRVGLGILNVNVKNGKVEVLTDPILYKPKKRKNRHAKLLREFNLRLGDPNIAGSSKTKIVTAYRQDALLCALLLAEVSQCSVKEIKKKTGVEKTASILQKNYYGWFKRINRGVYALSPDGKKGLKLFENATKTLKHLIKDQTIYKPGSVHAE